MSHLNITVFKTKVIVIFITLSLFLQQEYHKQGGENMDVINSNMALTFALRRQYLNDTSPSIRDIQGKYPYLFQDDQVHIYCCSCVKQLISF